jgi:2-methylcitrate dehydratase PrpD
MAQTAFTQDDPSDFKTGATRKLAEHAAGLKYEDLPADVVRATKRCILDTLGVTVGASGLIEESAVARQYVLDQGGKKESTIWGFGDKVTAGQAAFVNGSMGHMLDFDDIGGGHPSIISVPVAFAVAEKIGGVSGKDFIAAIAAGVDVYVRANRAITVHDWTMTEGWFATQLLGYVGGAVVAAHLMGADAEQMENAMGIGYNQMAGSRQMATPASTHMRAMQAGFSGQGSVQAADLAMRGLIGDKEIFEGRYGVYHNYVSHRDCEPAWEELSGALGEDFPILKQLGTKVWPACGYTRPVNAAIIHLRETHKIDPDTVDEIEVRGGQGATQLLSEPPYEKARPKISIDAKYSIPYTCGIAMLKGNVKLGDYLDEALANPVHHAMADKFRYVLDADASAKSPMPIVTIRTKSGETFQHQVTGLPGDVNNPVSQERLEEKFRDCASYAANPISKDDIERIVETCAGLENEDDATGLVKLVS